MKTIEPSNKSNERIDNRIALDSIHPSLKFLSISYNSSLSQVKFIRVKANKNERIFFLEEFFQDKIAEHKTRAFDIKWQKFNECWAEWDPHYEFLI